MAGFLVCPFTARSLQATDDLDQDTTAAARSNKGLETSMGKGRCCFGPHGQWVPGSEHS